MKSHMKLLAAAAVISVTGQALAQSEQGRQQHHPASPLAQAPPAPAPAQPPAAAPGQGQGQMPMGPMMQGMSEQCRAMMQSMPGCMGMMQQMMPGRMGEGMGQGGMMPGQMGSGGMMQGMPAQPAATSDATKAYMDAANRMHGPMMQGLQAADPDAAFVRGLIAHHQGAIDMAKVRLQYGKDDQTKKWAEHVLREQQREIAEMEAWLQKNPR